MHTASGHPIGRLSVWIGPLNPFLVLHYAYNLVTNWMGRVCCWQIAQVCWSQLCVCVGGYVVTMDLDTLHAALGPKPVLGVKTVLGARSHAC